MKTKNIVSYTASLFVCGALIASLTGCETGHCGGKCQAHGSIESQAKVSRADAEKAALAKVPGGTVKDGGLEKEKGKLIWSFDIAKADSKDITEVAVDAVTGEVVDVAVETPADQAKEAAADAKEDAKKDKDNDEKKEKGEKEDKK